MAAACAGAFPSLIPSATRSSMHHIVYSTVRVTKFMRDAGTKDIFGSMYICTDTRIVSASSPPTSGAAPRSSSHGVPSGDVAGAASSTAASSSVAADSPHPPENHDDDVDDAAGAARLASRHPRGSARNKNPPSKSIRTVSASSTSGTMNPAGPSRSRLWTASAERELTRTQMSPVASMSSTPHASRTASRELNGQGRSMVTRTTWEHRPC